MPLKRKAKLSSPTPCAPLPRIVVPLFEVGEMESHTSQFVLLMRGLTEREALDKLQFLRDLPDAFQHRYLSRPQSSDA